MSTYKINFKQLRQRPDFLEMLAALERGFAAFQLDFYLVGAVARDVWMTAINGIPPSRITRDIDFAVFIEDKGIYEKLKRHLIKIEHFQPSKENNFVLFWQGRMQVDLLPFGNIEDENAKVSLEGTGLTSLNMPGFKEIYESGLPEVELEGEHRFKFCTLPGIVILKLIAWEDRPEIRRDDLKDILTILTYFFEMYTDQIYEHHSDLFGDDDFGLNLIAARVMDREMKKIAIRNEKLYERLTNLLEKNTMDVNTSEIGKIMAIWANTTVAESLKPLVEIQLGFRGE
jgi:predicted nucleotidyltransferase